MDGSNARQISGFFADPDDVASNGQSLFSTGTGSIYRADMDGQNASAIVNLNTAFGSGTCVLQGITVQGKHVYWTDEYNDGIYRSGLNGESPVKLLSFPSALLSEAGTYTSPELLTSTASYLYWTDTNVPSIFRSDLDGSNVSTLVGSGSLTGSSLFGIAVNDSNLFWIEPLHRVYSSNLDGTNVTELIDIFEFSGGPILRGLAAHGTSLFVTSDGVDGSSVEGIFAADLNGDNLSQLIDLHTAFPTSHGNGPYGITVAAVPEPATVALLVGCGVFAAVITLRRRTAGNARNA